MVVYVYVVRWHFSDVFRCLIINPPADDCILRLPIPVPIAIAITGHRRRQRYRRRGVAFDKAAALGGGTAAAARLIAGVKQPVRPKGLGEEGVGLLCVVVVVDDD